MNKVEDFLTARPMVKDGVKVCDGCWAIYPDAFAWTNFTFRHLDPVRLCTTCLSEFKDLFRKDGDKA